MSEDKDDININDLRRALNAMQNHIEDSHRALKKSGVAPKANYNKLWRALEYLEYLETNYGHQAAMDTMFPNMKGD